MIGLKKESIINNEISRAKRKMRSQSGASITYALLLFLVCAVVSAIVLVAATTAAGRIAGIAEADQRYYSVTSSAQLIADIVDGKTVSAFKVGGNYIYFAKPAAEVTASDFSPTTNGLPGADPGAESQVADVSPIMFNVLSGSEKFITDLAKVALESSASPWYIRSTTGDLSLDPLAVTVQGGKKTNDNVYLDVSNTLNGPYNNSKFRPFTLRDEFETSMTKLDAQDNADDFAHIVSKLGGDDSELNITEIREYEFHKKSIKAPYDDL